MVKYFRRSTETERVCLSEGCNSIRWIQVKSKYSLSLAAPVRRKAAPHRTPFPTYTSCVLEMLVCSFSSSSSLYLTSSFALSPAECLGVFVLSLFFFSKAQNRLFLESFPFWRGAPQMEHTPRKVPPQSAPSRSSICFDRSGEELQQFAERRMGGGGERNLHAVTGWEWEPCRRGKPGCRCLGWGRVPGSSWGNAGIWCFSSSAAHDATMRPCAKTHLLLQYSQAHGFRRGFYCFPHYTKVEWI